MAHWGYVSGRLVLAGLDPHALGPRRLLNVVEALAVDALGIHAMPPEHIALAVVDRWLGQEVRAGPVVAPEPDREMWGTSAEAQQGQAAMMALAGQAARRG